jgi:hypothetical protein
VKLGKEIERLVKREDFVAAQALLPPPSSDPAEETRRLKLQASIYSAAGQYAKAANCLKTAQNLKPRSSALAAEYLRALVFCMNFLSAIEFRESLPKRVRSSDRVRRSTRLLYFMMGLKGAASIYEVKPYSARDRVWFSLKRPVRWVRVEFDQMVLNEINFRKSEVAHVGKVNYGGLERGFAVRASLDIAILRASRIEVIDNIARKWLTRVYFVLAQLTVVLYLALDSAVGFSPAGIVLTVLVVSLTYSLGGFLWEKVSSYLQSTVAIVVLSAALFVSRLAIGYDRSYILLVLAKSLSCSAVVLVVSAMVQLARQGLYVRALTRFERDYPRETLALQAAALLDGLDDLYVRHRAYLQPYLSRQLARLAELIDDGLVKYFYKQDKSLAGILSPRLRGASSRLRALSPALLYSTGSDLARLRKTLYMCIASAMTNNWWPFPSTAELVQGKAKPKLRVSDLARFVVVTIFPAVAVFAGLPLLSIDSGVKSWLELGAGVWVVVSLITLLDPSVKTKIDTARDVFGAMRQIDSKGRGGGNSDHRPPLLDEA